MQRCQVHDLNTIVGPKNNHYSRRFFLGVAGFRLQPLETNARKHYHKKDSPSSDKTQGNDPDNGEAQVSWTPPSNSDC